MNFKLFGKTILVVNIKFDFFWAIHSASDEPFGTGLEEGREGPEVPRADNGK